MKKPGVFILEITPPPLEEGKYLLKSFVGKIWKGEEKKGENAGQKGRKGKKNEKEKGERKREKGNKRVTSAK